jgi:membrane-associated phospholipid phosphatase
MRISGALWRAVAAFGCAACVCAQQPDDAGSPPVSRFHIEFLRNFGNLFRKDNLEPLLLGAAGSLAVVAPEDRVAGFFLRTHRMHEFGDTGEALGGPAIAGGAAGALFVAGRMTRNERFRELTYSLAQATAMSAALAGGVKACVPRERPSGEDQRSFYSGHTANAFAWATVLSRRRGLRVAIPSYAVAVLIGMSRLEKNKHYLTDVTAGATIGYIIGRSVGRTGEAGKPRRFGFGFTRLPGGVGISVQFRLDNRT